ncbi:aminotransferase class V-fold PLP-dependent enzyme [Streptomyces bathyalis]|uniref:Aminotransferase class V-fold PLP-dependent enzyme n=1 Tax=Streptomyces bathyalis TaxID=2710756 RepID=A0A7T1T2L0_9ACTN|nr:aminotransferase class V-fold PLP-dependent enzyme [Streptomyces bathyalis]QPP05209.1 aminotransferase class V-fold PLP-dependent enzyme [Streptomyces bathyalis]
MQKHATARDAEGPAGWSRLAVAQAEFDPDVTYLNTASLGLPPRRSLDALRRALTEWRKGAATPPAYDAPLESSRTAYAGLVGVDTDRVAVGSQVSAFAGLVAASLPEGSEVLTAAGEFTSLVFPFHAQARRGIQLREVPLERLAEAVTPRTALVAVSAVQSADGRLAGLDALTAVCEGTGTRILLDTTQATGWLPVDADRFAYTTCSGYKWLLAPRGTCFFTVRSEFTDELVPHAAGWYAGEERWDSLYGGPLRLAEDARRFDLSPAWHSWVAQAPALHLLAGVGTAVLHEHALSLANRFRAAVGLPPGDSAIVSAAVEPDTLGELERAAVVGSVRAGRLRLAFHLNNTATDADRAAEVVAGHLLEAAT